MITIYKKILIITMNFFPIIMPKDLSISQPTNVRMWQKAMLVLFKFFLTQFNANFHLAHAHY